MEVLIEKLLNDFQRNFPLDPSPFEQIARILNTSPEKVLETLRELQERGAVSRVGALTVLRAEPGDIRRLGRVARR